MHKNLLGWLVAIAVMIALAVWLRPLLGLSGVDREDAICQQNGFDYHVTPIKPKTIRCCKAVGNQTVCADAPLQSAESANDPDARRALEQRHDFFNILEEEQRSSHMPL